MRGSVGNAGDLSQGLNTPDKIRERCRGYPLFSGNTPLRAARQNSRYRCQVPIELLPLLFSLQDRSIEGWSRDARLQIENDIIVESIPRWLHTVARLVLFK